jgi:hypothetical protein
MLNGQLGNRMIHMSINQQFPLAAIGASSSRTGLSEHHLDMLSNGPVPHRVVQTTHRVTDLLERHPEVGGKAGNRHGVIDAHDKHRPVGPDSCQQVDRRRDKIPEQSGERSPLGVLILDPGGCLSGSCNSCRRGDLNP